eukprot:scaffold7695_cov124-Isochrysis_galbana.AAC.7
MSPRCRPNEPPMAQPSNGSAERCSTERRRSSRLSPPWITAYMACDAGDSRWRARERSSHRCVRSTDIWRCNGCV